MSEVPNYPSNSHKSKKEPAKVEKDVKQVTTGVVVKRKRGLGRKVAETFTGEDLSSVGGYILFEVIIPAAKAMLSDAASQGVERVLFGESRPRNASGGARTNYSTYSKSGQNVQPARTISTRGRASHDFNEIVLETRAEAEVVIERLGDLIDNFDIATVADLYDLVGITGDFVDQKWGWTNLRGAHVSVVRGGYLLNLPRTEAIS